MLIFAASEMTIRVTFPREGKALSILPILKELLRQLFYCMYFATKYLKNEAPFIVSALVTPCLAPCDKLHQATTEKVENFWKYKNLYLSLQQK